MPDIVCVRLDWDRTAIPLRLGRFHDLHVAPEPGWPFGRKGLALAGAWRQLATPAAAGMLLLDGDVAADPADRDAMLAAIDAEPEAVHAAPVRLWPVSTHLPRWVWGHGRGGYGTEDTDDPDTFTFCFTFLPRALISGCLRAGLAEWAYPHVDRNTCEQARALGIPVRVVRDAYPVHLNFLARWPGLRP